VAWKVRKGALDDASRVAEINVEGWRGAYRGILADEYLDAMRPGDRLERIELRLTAPPPDTMLLAEDESRFVGAYAGLTAARDAGDEHPHLPTGEFAALYADPAVQGAGAGSSVHQAGVEYLAEQGFKHAVLWVFERNTRSRKFYEARGWECDEVVKEGVLGGAAFTEIRYSRGLS